MGPLAAVVAARRQVAGGALRGGRVGPLVSLAVALVSPRAAAQPDWLPAAARDDRARAAAAAPVPGDPCADRLLGRLAPPLRDSGFDRGQDACLTAAFVADGRYWGGPDVGDRGALAADLAVRWLYLADLELELGARVAFDRFAPSGEGEGEDTVFGPVHARVAAGHVARAWGRPLRLAWSLRLDLPWTDTADGGPTVAASPQVGAALQLRPGLVGQARLAALLGLALPDDDVDTRRAAALSADLSARPWRWLVAGAGFEVQSGWYGAGLDHLAARAGIRLPVGGRAHVELAVAAPLAGDEPVELAGELRLVVGR